MLTSIGTAVAENKKSRRRMETPDRVYNIPHTHKKKRNAYKNFHRFVYHLGSSNHYYLYISFKDA